MGYELNALFGKTEVLEQINFPLNSVTPIPLSQGFSLIPLPLSIYSDDDIMQEFEEGWLSKAIVQSILNDVTNGEVAFLFADFFGGRGLQYAIVWNSGKILQEFPSTSNHNIDSMKNMSINRALQLIGVDRGEFYDEFDAMNLGRYRHTSNWYDSR